MIGRVKASAIIYAYQITFTLVVSCHPKEVVLGSGS